MDPAKLPEIVSAINSLGTNLGWFALGIGVYLIAVFFLFRYTINQLKIVVGGISDTNKALKNNSDVIASINQESLRLQNGAIQLYNTELARRQDLERQLNVALKTIQESGGKDEILGAVQAKLEAQSKELNEVKEKVTAYEKIDKEKAATPEKDHVKIISGDLKELKRQQIETTLQLEDLRRLQERLNNPVGALGFSYFPNLTPVLNTVSPLTGLPFSAYGLATTQLAGTPQEQVYLYDPNTHSLIPSPEKTPPFSA